VIGALSKISLAPIVTEEMVTQMKKYSFFVKLIEVLQYWIFQKLQQTTTTPSFPVIVKR
jgi:hypothetical protein